MTNNRFSYSNLENGDTKMSQELSDDEPLPNVDFADEVWSVAYAIAVDEAESNNPLQEATIIKVCTGYSPSINDSGDPSDEFSTIVLYADFCSEEKSKVYKNNTHNQFI